MRIEEQTYLDYKDVLIKPKRSSVDSRRDVNLIKEICSKNNPKRKLVGFPVISSNMFNTGTFKIAEKLCENNAFGCIKKYYTIEDFVRNTENGIWPKICNTSFVSIGTENDPISHIQNIMGATGTIISNVCIDVANGYRSNFVDFIKKFRDTFPDVFLMAGNVCSPEMTQELIIQGVDIVKVGIGPSPFCLTRRITGVGIPQLSAVIQCADAAHGNNGLICADGGCQHIGDISKSICAGADLVMLGSMISGCEEGDGEMFCDPLTGEKLIVVSGSASKEIVNKFHGGDKQYRSFEGRTEYVQFRGSVCEVIKEIKAGVASTATYIGTDDIKHFGKCATFIKVNRQLNDFFDKN